MKKSLDQYDDAHDGVKKTWNIMQSYFKCCGVSNATDWTGKGSLGAGDVPDSCCKTNTPGCGKGAMTDSTKIYTVGCFSGFEMYIADNAGAAAGVGVGVIALLFLGICGICVIIEDKYICYPE